MTVDNFTPIDLDADLDSIDDLPGFSTFPSGAYHMNLFNGLEEKKINEKPAIEAAMKLVSVLEMTETGIDEKDMPKVGDICSTAFLLDNPVGAGVFKQFATPIGEKLGTKKIRELMTQCKGMDIMVVLKRTYDDKKDRHYIKVKKVAVL